MECTNLLENGQPCGDEGRLCEGCHDREMREHEYLRHQPRHMVINDEQSREEYAQELRDAGRGHLVSP